MMLRAVPEIQPSGGTSPTELDGSINEYEYAEETVDASCWGRIARCWGNYLASGSISADQSFVRESFERSKIRVYESLPR